MTTMETLTVIHRYTLVLAGLGAMDYVTLPFVYAS